MTRVCACPPRPARRDLQVHLHISRDLGATPPRLHSPHRAQTTHSAQLHKKDQERAGDECDDDGKEGASWGLDALRLSDFFTEGSHIADSEGVEADLRGVDPELNRGCAPAPRGPRAKPSCSAPASRQVLPSTEEKDLTSGLM